MGLVSSTTAPERILERAIEVIDADGEVAIRVWGIAQECGVTGPILYRAFGSREGLIIAAQAERYRRSLAIGGDFGYDVLTQSTSAEDFLERSIALFNLASDPERSRQRAVRASVLGSAISRPELLEAIVAMENEVYAQMALALEWGQERGWFRADLDAKAFCALYIGMMTSRIHIELPGSIIDGASWNRTALEALMRVGFAVED